MKQVLMILLIVTSLGSLVGCAKEKKQAAVAPPPGNGALPLPPGSGGNTGGDTSKVGDNEVDMSNVSNASLGEMFFKSPINKPQNLRFGMDVSKQGDGYGGNVWVTFEDGGVTRKAMMSTRHPSYPGTANTKHNIWFDYNGKNAFHGFFQDLYGAMVIVIDSTIDLGDGQPSALVGGSVWFQNFGPVGIQGPLKMCWEISIGPFDCRTFLVGSKVVTASALYPNNYGNDSIPDRQPYRKLGDFGGMLRSEAFHD